MKCSEVVVVFPDESYVTVQEDGVSFKDLHLVYRDGLACVNYMNEEGTRVNYDYPISTVDSIHHKANQFHSVKH